MGVRFHRELQRPPRDELLNDEIFYTLREAKIVIESWRRHYNTVRPHASNDYRLRHKSPYTRRRRMAGCGTRTSSPGRAPAGAKACPKLTLQSDHPVGAGQIAL